MAKLQMLSFEDDDIIARRIKEESNYCDVAHLDVALKTKTLCFIVETKGKDNITKYHIFQIFND